MMRSSSGHGLFKGGRRGRTEPVPVQYMTESPIMLKHPYDLPPFPQPAHDSAGSPISTPLPTGKWTQQHQNERDAELRKVVQKELIDSWQDRLQLISVITTFFAAVEGGLLVIVTPERGQPSPRIEQAATTGLVGSLVVHLFAAIISFLASFFLIRYRVEEAKIEERKVEEGANEKQPAFSGIWSSNPRLAQCGPFRRDQPPTHLLERCHSLCILFGAVGFVLAIVGVVCLAWARMQGSPSIFVTVCVALCSVASIVIILTPSPTLDHDL